MPGAVWVSYAKMLFILLHPEALGVGVWVIFTQADDLWYNFMVCSSEKLMHSRLS